MNDIDLEGKVLDGRYRVTSRLGAGAMATVYLAHQESLDRDVVVKVPDAALAADEEFILRFQQEIRSLTKLRHPRIVSILEAGEINGVPYAVMDYLEGGNLKERMSDSRGGGMHDAPGKILEWLSPVAQALDFVHGKGVVHRDVKPANLLFDGDGNPFLSDFGIAKALGPMDSEITRTGSTVGTALYMAPEQGLDGAITGAADQYALAAIAFEMICGRPPHVGGTAPVTMVKKLTEGAPEIGDLAPELPEYAAAAVMRALERAPGKRFPSCSAFIDAFAAGLADDGDASAPLLAEVLVEGEPGLDDATDALMAPVATPLEEPEEPAGPGELTGTLFQPVARDPGGEPESKTDDAAGPAVAATPRVPVDKPLPRKRGRGILIAGVAAAIVAAGLLILSRGGGSGSGSDAETTPPEIHLTIDRSPPDGALYATPSVEVAGRVQGDPEAWVELGGVRADLDAGGGFTATADLEEGENVLTFRVLRSDHEVVETRAFTVVVDTRAPGIVLDTPTDGLLVRDPRLTVGGRVVDLHPGGVTVAGVAARLGADGAFLAEAALTEGGNELEVRARDEAGNEAVEVRTVILDSRAPSFSLDPLAEVTAAPVVVVTGTLHEYGCWVSVNGVPAALMDKRFICSVPLVAGRNTIEAVVVDPAGNRAASKVSVTFDDQPPAVSLDPLPEVTGEARITVSGDLGHPDTRVTVNGVEAEVEGTRFSCQIPLSSGENRVKATAANRAGLSTSAEGTVVLDDEPPTVQLDELPESTDAPSVRVTGKVDEEGCIVTVNGIEAAVRGTRFSCEVLLSEGENAIKVVAIDRVGHRGAAAAMVRHGEKALVVKLDPQPAVTVEPSITVTGTVDRVGCTVTVNGVSARIGGTNFKCVVRLALGDNEIVATATSPDGSSGSARMAVRREAAPNRPPRVRIDPLRASVNSRRITISGSVDRDGCSVTVNGAKATVTGRKYSCSIPFTSELREIVVIATDPEGLMGGARAKLNVRDR